MKKTINMKKAIRIIAVILCVIFIIELCSKLTPHPLEDSPFYATPVAGTTFESDYHKIGNVTLGIYTFIGDQYADNGDDEFVITIVERTGIRNNQYVISLNEPQSDEVLVSPEYSNINKYPQREVKKGKKYYGSVYVGIAPPNYKTLTIDGHEMTLKKMSLTLNNKKCEFFLYYGFIVDDNPPSDDATVEYTA